MNTEKLIIARKLLHLAKLLLAKEDDYKYIYDPTHKKRPGSGFKQTPRGWSKKEERTNGNELSGNEKVPFKTESLRETSGNRPRHSYQPTNDFRRVHRASVLMPDAVKQDFHSDRKRADANLLGRLSRVLQRQLETSGWLHRPNVRLLKNPKTGENKTYVANVPGDLFHDVFETCHAYLLKGDCVDIHEAQDYQDSENYLSADGLSGFSIKNGDLISVFNLSPERGMLKTIAPIIKERCRTLDCFDSEKQHLPEFYSGAFGFKTASVLDFNYDLLAQEKGKDYAEHFVKTYGESPVHFMVNTDSEVEVKHFSKDQWEDAYNYQQSIAFPEKKKSSRTANKNIPWNIPLYVLIKRG